MKKNNINISVISNVMIEPFFTKKISGLFNNLYNVEVNNIMYEDYINNADIIKASNLVLVWININSLFPNLYIQHINGTIKTDILVKTVTDLFITLIKYINDQGTTQIIVVSQENNDDNVSQFLGNIVSNNDIIRVINNEIITAISPVATIVDINKVMLNVGLNNAYDYVNKYRWNAVYSEELIGNVAGEIYKQYTIDNGITKKCVILDCDNVLWGGILSEDGIQNIKLSDIGEGLFYQEFQRFILNLYYHGVILAIASKNEYDDIIKVFREHSGMILKVEHISCFQVNWDNKANSVLKIADYLNIGLDSIIFVDDSPFEINLINKTIPDVTTILFEYDKRIYSQFNCINLKDTVDYEMINIRTATYQANSKRNLLKERSIDYDEYLTSLKTNIDIHRTNECEINRISELSQRTNQCTNGARFTIDDLQIFVKDTNYDMYSVFVEDIFGALGLVGAIIIDIKENSLLLFSLSCRALGRKVEERMLMFINDNYKLKQVLFVDTNKYKNKAIKESMAKYFHIVMNR